MSQSTIYRTSDHLLHQEQVGPQWRALSGVDIIYETTLLSESGALLPLIEPRISIQACGRPRSKLSSQENNRLRGFWERMERLESLAESTVTEVCHVCMISLGECTIQCDGGNALAGDGRTR